MPYFYVNADKKPYRFTGVEKNPDTGKYLVYAERYEEHRVKHWGITTWKGRTHHYSFLVPNPKKKTDIRVEDIVYSCKKADQMTVERLVNHLSTLFALEQL